MNLLQPPNFKYYGISGIFTEKIPKEKVKTLEMAIVFPEQIHSSEVIQVTDYSLPITPRADGIICQRDDLVIGIKTADCLPILIADIKKRLVCGVHAGWRGTIGGILSRALEQIFDCGLHPEDLIVAIGPHIQGSCYQVGEDLVEVLPPYLRKSPHLVRLEGQYFLNLTSINLQILTHYKIPEKNIWISSECTHCLPQKYHSYRRERNYLYTQLALISLHSNVFQKINELFL